MLARKLQAWHTATSPAPNPIKLASTTFKKRFREVSERTVASLWELNGPVIETFTETECRSYIKHCEHLNS